MSTQQRRAVVVGAGVGGLAAAGALARDGWQVDLLERRPQIRAVGAGLSLWPNALRAIAAIDPAAVDQLRGRNELQDMVGLRRPDGRWLSRVEPSPAGAEDADSAGAADAFTVPLMVTRPKLYDVLRDLVPAESLHLGRTATGVDAGPAGAVVRTDGEEYPADLVVAADGIHSRLRTSVDPRTRTRGAGYVTWRALIPPESAPALVSGSETWGAASGSAAFRWPTAASTGTPRSRTPTPATGPTAPRTCPGCSPTGTIPFPGCSEPPRRTGSSVPTSNCCGRCRAPSSATGWCSSATPRTR